MIDIQLQIILTLQSLGEWLVVPMKMLSFLGTQEFYLLIAPALYWCVDAGLGLRFGIGLMITGSLNTCLKYLFHTPRPFWISPQVHAYTVETSFGLPSGHAQNSVVVFGIVARALNTPWSWLGAILLSLLIGLSRLYLGVHFPGDVLVGWLVGAALLIALLQVETLALPWIRSRPEAVQYGLIILASLMVLGLGWLTRTAALGYPLPTEWARNVAAVQTEGESFDPLDFSDIVSYSGTILGWVGGAMYLHRRGGFQGRGNLLQRLARYLIGLAGVVAIFYGLSALFPGGDTWVAYLLRYVHYALVGLWISALAPILFIRLRLAG